LTSGGFRIVSDTLVTIITREDKVKTMRMLYETKNSNYWRDEIAASKGNTMALVANIR